MKLKHKTILILLTQLMAGAQYADAQENKSHVRNTLYLEGAKNGADYSMNYDRVFRSGNKFSKSYRVGFAIFNNTIALPAGIQFFSGNGVHHPEFSLTLIPYAEGYRDWFSGNNISDKKMWVIPGVGYRYQKPTGGFFAKMVAGPAINLDPPSDHFWKMNVKVYPGVAIGAGFNF